MNWRYASAAALILAIGLALPLRADNAKNPKVSALAHEGYWLKDQTRIYETAMAMLDKPAPHLALVAWHGKQVKPADMKGKIVLIDFWATWCGPCLAQIPHANEISKKYADKGVVVFGACCPRGSDTMSQTATEHAMEYPTGKMTDVATQEWKIQFWPTYAVIDREGQLRAIGLEPNFVEPVLDALLEEQPPKENSK